MALQADLLCCLGIDLARVIYFLQQILSKKKKNREITIDSERFFKAGRVTFNTFFRKLKHTDIDTSQLAERRVHREVKLQMNRTLFQIYYMKINSVQISNDYQLER